MYLKSFIKNRLIIESLLLPFLFLSVVTFNYSVPQTDSLNWTPEISACQNLVVTAGINPAKSFETRTIDKTVSEVISNMTNGLRELKRSTVYLVTLNQETVVNFRHYSFISSHFSTST